jgi:hypothetical protein
VAERERLESTNRTLQAAKDRAEAENARLKAQLEGKGDGGEPKSESAMTSDDFLALLDRRDTLLQTASSLKEQFPLADPSLFSKATSYESPEALRVAVEESHGAKQAEKDAVRASVEAEVRAQYAEKFGELPASPPDDDGGSGAGALTPEQARGMSFSEIDAFVAEHGQEAWDRIVRSS